MQIRAKTIRIAFLLSILGVVSACQSTPIPNPYEQFFSASGLSVAGFDMDPRFRVVETSAPPQLINSTMLDAQELLYSYQQNNFHLIGSSNFNGPYLGSEGIIDKALEIGATHVLYWVAETDSIAVQSSQVVTSTSNSNATIGNPNIFNGSIPVRNTTTTLSSVPVTQNVRMFGHSAGFLVQVEPTSLFKGIGITMGDLSDKMKLDKKIDYGVVVVVVMSGSIAQRSGLIRDDVILKVNGNPAYQVNDLSEKIIDAYDIQEPMTLEILRADGRELTRIVNFQ
jgi:hypothetical protein